MKHFLIKQGIFLPIIYFGFIIIAGFYANDYSHWGQHASELGINATKSAVILFKVGIFLTSTSLFALALGLLRNFKRKYTLSSILIFAFGATFIFGAIYPIGSPWHGFYGFGLFIMILPFVFLYETGEQLNSKTLHRLSIAAGLLMFLYLWSMIARLDPINLRGLTQRLFGIVVFGWFSYISYHLSKLINRNIH
ncbi:MAG: DUF998 domain-containing protein [Bacteroidetes bacterium]|jgi:hypothetical protein|nr:DUF998 domain-containing protein [Bacteroidota bacterium]